MSFTRTAALPSPTTDPIYARARGKRGIWKGPMIFALLAGFVVIGASGNAKAKSPSSKNSLLHYSGDLTGSASFNALNCTLRSGHLVGLGDYAAIGKSTGPNITFFSEHDDGTGQHLGFVPTGKNQQHFYFNTRATDTITGLDTTQITTNGTITFKHVELHNPGAAHNRLTLSGTLLCTNITR